MRKQKLTNFSSPYIIGEYYLWWWCSISINKLLLMVTFYVTLVFIYNTHEHTLTYEFLDIKLVEFKVLSIVYTKSRKSDYIPDFYKVFTKPVYICIKHSWKVPRGYIWGVGDGVADWLIFSIQRVFCLFFTSETDVIFKWKGKVRWILSFFFPPLFRKKQKSRQSWKG